MLTTDFLLAPDADSLAHTVYEPNSPAVHEIAQAFGKQVLNDDEITIHRKELGKIVFADPAALKQLEQIVWPHVKTALMARIDQVKADYEASKEHAGLPIVVVEAAVLLDAGWQSFLDGVWVVQTSKPVALERLTASRGISQDEAVQRIQAQESRRGIGNLADEVGSGVVTAVIDNSGTMDDLIAALRDRLADPKAWYDEDRER
jgi:dephospho-CoA kinase